MKEFISQLLIKIKIRDVYLSVNNNKNNKANAKLHKCKLQYSHINNK